MLTIHLSLGSGCDGCDSYAAPMTQCASMAADLNEPL